MSWRGYSPKVLRCNCSNRYQDERFGPGRRLHNASAGVQKPNYRCTVCANEKTSGAK